MIGFSVQAGKQGFFDRAKVQRAMDRATRKALSKFGAFVRRRAQTSIRKRRAASEPGMPPSGHTGLLRKFIMFAADVRAKDVIIGPAKLNGTKSDTALKALEHGGQTLIMRRGKPKLVTIGARPFMRPAFEEEIKRAPDLWANALK